MNDEQIWAIYYAGVAALKFHPRNETERTHAEKVHEAALIADLMLNEHRRRFICHG